MASEFAVSACRLTWPATELAVHSMLLGDGRLLSYPWRNAFSTRGVGLAGSACHPSVILEATLAAIASSAGHCI